MIGDKNKTHNLMSKDMQTGNTKTHGFNIHVIFETDTQPACRPSENKPNGGKSGARTKSETREVKKKKINMEHSLFILHTCT